MRGGDQSGSPRVRHAQATPGYYEAGCRGRPGRSWNQQWGWEAQRDHTDWVQVNLKVADTGDRSHPFYVQSWFPTQPPPSSPVCCLGLLPQPGRRHPGLPLLQGLWLGFLLPLSPPPACPPHTAREIVGGRKADHATSGLCPVLQKRKASLHPPDSKVLHRSETLSRWHPDLRHTALNTPTGLPVVSARNLPGQVVPRLRLNTYCSSRQGTRGLAPLPAAPLSPALCSNATS